MKNHGYLLIVAAALLAALAWWLVREPRERGLLASSVPTRPGNIPHAALPETLAPNQSERVAAEKSIAAAAVPSTPDWSKRIRESEDYWAFAESAIGPAKAGDGDARYWLALALNECKLVYPFYFNESLPGKPERRRTLDEAQQRVATMRSLHSPDDLALLEKRCIRLDQAKGTPFGDGSDWMAAALAVDNPLAQATVASEKAMASPYKPDPEKARADARRLIVAAVRRPDTEVLLRVGDAADSLAFENLAEGKLRRLSWTLAACLRTPNCEGLALWKKTRCTWDSQCQPYETPRDIIRRDAGSDFDEVERRARELNEKIDAGTLDESDL